MDLVRRNTDYALRLIVLLVKEFGTGRRLSARWLSRQGRVSYPITCKLLQRLQRAGLAASAMGPKGGFELAKSPEQITFKEAIECIQGPVRVNKCVFGDSQCPLQSGCPLHPRLVELQEQIDRHLAGATLAEIKYG